MDLALEDEALCEPRNDLSMDMGGKKARNGPTLPISDPTKNLQTGEQKTQMKIYSKKPI